MGYVCSSPVYLKAAASQWAWDIWGLCGSEATSLIFPISVIDLLPSNLQLSEYVDMQV